MVPSRRDFFAGSCRWWCCGAAPVIGQPLTVDGARALAADINRQRARGIDVIAHYKAIKQRQGAGVRQQGTFPTHARDFIDRHARPKTRRWRETARLLGYDFPPDGDDAAPVLIKGSLSDRWRDRSEEKARAAAGGFPSTALVRLCAYLSFRLELCDEAIAAKQKVAEQAKQAVGVKMGSPKGTKVPRADVGSARGSQTNAANADTFAELLRSVFNELKDLSATAAAQELTRQGIATARGGTWSTTSVINVRERLK